MFGIFGKKSVSKSAEDYIDMNNVRVFYEGEVISSEYDLNSPDDYPFHNLFPDGKGKIKYFKNDKTLEEYEGDFKVGQYHGNGVLIDRYGEVLEGIFGKNKYIDKK